MTGTEESKMTKIVIVGGGPAAVAAALGAKATAPNTAVTLVTDEAYEPYEKPILSKEFLLGARTPESAPIAGLAGVSAKGIEVVRGTCAAIDRAARLIVLTDGRAIGYEKLVLATGARVRRLPVAEDVSSRVHYLRSAADAEKFKRQLLAARSIIIVGGGLIGLEVAASAAKLGHQVTVLEAGPSLAGRSCPPDIAEHLLHAHRANGITVALNAGMTSAMAAADQVRVSTSNGIVECDVMLVAVGIVPETSLAEAASLVVRDGIVVDDSCRTSDDAIFAAGDAVRFPGPSGLARLENWNHALAQGRVAGANAAGAAETYKPLPNFWSAQGELYLQGIGWPSYAVDRCTRRVSETQFAIFELANDVVQAAFGVNMQRDMQIARRLIERSVKVSASMLSDTSLPLQLLLQQRATA
jgi:NADPH-dependent 2,4-dienoyl-CoA reductase/sulfur reductase-like enzyme